jgi:dTDP-glucose 4,6-dehydratase
LNWNPKVSFEEGIKTTVEWYLKNQEWWKDITDIKTLNSIQWKS